MFNFVFYKNPTFLDLETNIMQIIAFIIRYLSPYYWSNLRFNLNINLNCLSLTVTVTNGARQAAGEAETGQELVDSFLGQFLVPIPELEDYSFDYYFF